MKSCIFLVSQSISALFTALLGVIVAIMVYFTPGHRLVKIKGNQTLILVGFSITSISNNNVVLSKLKAEIWEHDDIIKNHLTGQTIRPVGSKPSG